MSKILLIEDDLEICEMVKKFLSNEGYEITVALDGEQGIELFRDDIYDLLLLDIMMPKLDGFSVIQRVRANSTIPIIIISARDTEFDKISGLGMGSDDYVTKPFSMKELLARIESNLRRSTQYLHNNNNIKEYKIGNIIMNLDNFTHAKVITPADKEIPVIHLGPVSITPELHRQGYGRALIVSLSKRIRASGR